LIYAVAIFLSSFLLFLVQPLIARLILPWFGGSAAVWTTCMLFFQALLLAGYAYAHFLTKDFFRGKRQALVHSLLLAVAAATLPIAPAEAGLRSIEAVLGAYASGATGRVVALPLSLDDPVFQRGVIGLRELPLWADGPVFKRNVFGVKTP